MTNMSSPDISRLPIGVQDFCYFHRDGLIYVDKTDKLFQLSQLRYVFLSRPRRFGKSLILSMLASLWRGEKGLFTGLKIERLWKEEPYAVIALDFSVFKNSRTHAEFLKRFDDHLKIRIQIAGEGTSEDSSDPLSRWEIFLARLRGKRIVLLIDEYDAPLNTHLNNLGYFNEIKSSIASFFDLCKSYSGNLKFMFVTGILKFRQASLFSTFNNITDISLRPEFGEIAGYTEEESELTPSNFSQC